MISQKLIQSWRCLGMRGNEKWHGDEIILCFLSLTSPDSKVTFLCSHPGIFLSQSSLTQCTEINFQVKSWLEEIQTWSCNLQFEVSKLLNSIFCFPGARICWLMAQNDDADVLITLQSHIWLLTRFSHPICWLSSWFLDSQSKRNSFFSKLQLFDRFCVSYYYLVYS